MDFRKRDQLIVIDKMNDTVENIYISIIVLLMIFHIAALTVIAFATPEMFIK